MTNSDQHPPKKATGQWMKETFETLLTTQVEERKAAEKKDKFIIFALIGLVVIAFAVMAGRELSIGHGDTKINLGTTIENTRIKE